MGRERRGKERALSRRDGREEGKEGERGGEGEREAGTRKSRGRDKRVHCPGVS